MRKDHRKPLPNRAEPAQLNAGLRTNEAPKPSEFFPVPTAFPFAASHCNLNLPTADLTGYREDAQRHKKQSGSALLSLRLRSNHQSIGPGTEAVDRLAV